MSVAIQTFRQRGCRLITTFLAPQACQHRFTSWVAWEQPSPTLYTPPYAPPSGESQQAATNYQGTRNIGETVVEIAIATTAVGSQEISMSEGIAPSSIQAGASCIPHSQARSIQTQSENIPLLPTTLLRIPGVTATWPSNASKYPDQQRVRKHATSVHENEGPRRAELAQSQTRNILERLDTDEKSS